MYSQSYLPNNKQSHFSAYLPHNIGLIRNCTTKSYSKMQDSYKSAHTSINYKLTVDTPNQYDFRSRSHLMDLMYSLKDSSRYTFSRHFNTNFTVPSENPRSNCKGMVNNYNSAPTIPLMSSNLVGGFVGSKSQLGRRPSHGFGIKMWDIIRELLVDLVGNSSTSNSSKEQPMNSPKDLKLPNMLESKDKHNLQPTKCNSVRHIVDKKYGVEENGLKQSYADVTKTKLPKGITNEEPPARLVERNIDGKCTASSKVNRPIVLIEPNTQCCRTMNYSSSRDRIASECSADSEDSFIVFEYSEGDDCSIDSDDGSSEDESILDCQAYEESASSCSSLPSRKLNLIDSCKSPIKKVRFAEGKELVKVHRIVAWDHAYRMARRGPWEMLARDSERFRCRIRKTEAVLTPILSPQHREAVFRQRFSEVDSAS